MKKIICMLLSIACLFTFAACSGGGNGSGADVNVEEPEPIIENPVMTYENETELEENCIRINGYESQNDFNTMLQYSYLGKTTLETQDASKIKSGNASAKVVVMPDPFYGALSGTPQIYQAMKNVSRGVNCMDFRNVYKIQFWIYNAQSTEEQIAVRLEYESHYTQGQSSDFKYYNIKPGWTLIEYDVNTSLIPEVSTALRGDDRNGEGEMILRVCGLLLRFTTRPATGEPEKTFYLDDFVVCKNTAE